MSPGDIESAYGLKYATPMYRVAVTVRGHVVREGRSYPVPAGSLAQTDILLERKSIARWLLEPVIKRFRG